MIRRFEKAPRLILMVATIGLAQVLAGIAKAVPEFLTPGLIPPRPLPAAVRFSFDDPADHLARRTTSSRWSSTVVTSSRCSRSCASPSLGIALRASSQSADRASLLGVNVGLMHNVAWIIATLVAAIAMILRAGVLGLPLGSAFGPSILFRALAAAVIGRMENFAVIFAAACGIGIVETAILWNEGSTRPARPRAVRHRPRRAAPAAAAPRVARSRTRPVSSWDDAAKVRPIPRELARLPEVRWAFRGIVARRRSASCSLLPRCSTTATRTSPPQWSSTPSSRCRSCILTGWAGEISLGQVAFVAIGSAAAGARQRALAASIRS